MIFYLNTGTENEARFFSSRERQNQLITNSALSFQESKMKIAILNLFDSCRVFLIIILFFRKLLWITTVKLRVSFPPTLWKGSFRGFKPIYLFVWGGGVSGRYYKIKGEIIYLQFVVTLLLLSWLKLIITDIKMSAGHL